MRLRTLFMALAALLVSTTVYLMWPKEAVTPEDAVRHEIAQMMLAAQQGKAADILERIDASFQGPSGLHKDELKGYLLAQFLQSPKGVVVLNPSLTVTEVNAASVRFEGQFLLARDGQAQALADNAGLRRIAGTFALVDGQWRCNEAQWAP